MSKRFRVFCLVCLMLVFSGTAAFASERGEYGVTISALLMTQEKAAVMPKDDMMKMCNDQKMVMMDKMSMDKMMMMMTNDQMMTMMNSMMMDTMSKDQMMEMGTKEQWMAMTKDQMMMNMDKMMMNMTKDQMSKMTDKMMMNMTKDQMTTMMMDNTNALLTTTSAVEPMQNSASSALPANQPTSGTDDSKSDDHSAHH